MDIQEAREALHSEDETTRHTAVRWLFVLGGPEAIQVLLGALDDPVEEVRVGAMRVLQGLKAVEAVPVLCERLNGDFSAGERATMASVLGLIGDVRALEALRAALKDNSVSVAWQACGALGGLPDPRVPELLLGALDHPMKQVREAAVAALVELKVDDPRVRAALEGDIQAAEERGDYYYASCPRRMLAALTGGEISSPDVEEADRWALSDALAHLANEEPEIRRRAAQQLGGFGGPEVVAALIGAMSDSSAPVRGAAALALGGLEAPEGLSVLLEHLVHDESSHVRVMCGWFMHCYKDASAVEPLIAALEDPDMSVVTGAATVLGLLGDERAIPGLLRLLDLPEWYVRYYACESLMQLGAREPRLVAALEHLAREPEAAEHDLRAREWNQADAALPEYEQEGEPALTIGELLERARALGESGT